MSNSHKTQAYRQAAVTTASKEKILLMLYETAIRQLGKALEAMEAKEMAAKGIAIGKVHDIINELTNTLDFDVGGEIAKNLERLYTYMTEGLVKANSNNDPAPLKEILKILEGLHGAWKEAIGKLGKDHHG